MAFGSQMLRDQSHGSQNEFNFSEQTLPMGMIINKGSTSNFSSDFERSGIKSAAQKYMHVIPGGTEAIEEEAENYGTSGLPHT